MSRIGKNPINVPEGVSLEIEGVVVKARGKLGELTVSLTDDIEVTQKDKLIWVKPKNSSKESQKMWGTSQSIISNLVLGVSEGFHRKLELNGVGYRAQIQGTTLNMQLGFSEDINFPIPEGVEIRCSDQTHIDVFGADKQKVGQVAAEIRAYRRPEPYKGKGIKYEDEYILRKEGKKK